MPPESIEALRGQSEQITNGIGQTHKAVETDHQAIIQLRTKGLAELNAILSLKERAESLSQQILDIQSQLSDVLGAVNSIKASVETEAAQFDEIVNQIMQAYQEIANIHEQSNILFADEVKLNYEMILSGINSYNFTADLLKSDIEQADRFQTEVRSKMQDLQNVLNQI